MGGQFVLQLESVRVVQTQNNYEPFQHAFNMLDRMLSGLSWNASQKDAWVVRGAVRECLNIERNGYDQFVNDAFRHFCARKTQIVLNLLAMRQKDSVGKQDIVSLVMNDVKVQKKCSDVSDNDVNLLKPVMFELFGNVQELVMVTTNVYDAKGKSYAFNLERLSQYAFPKSLRTITIKGKWLKDAHTDSFGERGWKAKLKGDELKLLRCSKPLKGSKKKRKAKTRRRRGKKVVKGKRAKKKVFFRKNLGYSLKNRHFFQTNLGYDHRVSLG